MVVSGLLKIYQAKGILADVNASSKKLLDDNKLIGLTKLKNG